MLLEVSCEESSLSARFLCEASANNTVRSVLERVVTLHNVRTELAFALSVLGLRGNQTSGSKRSNVEDERERAIAAADALLSPLSVRRKVVMRLETLQQALGELRAHVKSESAGDAAPCIPLDAEMAELFFGGRSLQREQLLADYAGRNEKTKVKVELRSPEGATALARSSDVDAPIVTSGPSTSVIAAASSDVLKGNAACSLNGAQASFVPGAKTVQHGEASREFEGAATNTMESLADSAEKEVSLSSFFNQSGRGSQRSLSEEEAGREGLPLAKEEEEELLSKAEEEELRGSQPLDQIGALNQSRLLEQMRYIDGASSREIALHRLEAALTDEEFHNFSEGLLHTIGRRPKEPPPY